MVIENINIVSFIKILKVFSLQGATSFGMEIKNEGDYIKLFPLRPETQEEPKEIKEDKPDEDEDSSPLINSKV